ncbi:MAG TPA: alpha/beta hydrolase-fold protein [Rhizomicrobium sp.]|jgi:enterochelin esterase family protein|nr:alpha/beta hydrolase-fold protein [Rhizomicrobium sp.]
MRKFTWLFPVALVAALPALAQAPATNSTLPKFPTPPPAVTAENSIIGPSYADASESVANSAVPQGDVREFILYSEDSKIYPGIVRVHDMQRDANGNYVAPPGGLSAPGRYERHVYVYIPKQLVPGTPAPFMVVQDGHSYVKRMVNIMDNMIAAKRLPPIVLILADSGGSDAQGSERGLEYDTLSDRYSNWVEQELLPAVSQRYGVTFTTDPQGRATMGGSSGGVCAWTMAWYHPERYHKVLSYSGTFVNQAWPPDPKTPRGGWEYHATLIPKTAKKPIRIWMEVGEKDNRFDNPEESWHNWPLANNRMAEVLKRKGYDYRYVFAMGAGHVDNRVVMQTLPSALEWLWRDYPK